MFFRRAKRERSKAAAESGTDGKPVSSDSASAPRTPDEVAPAPNDLGFQTTAELEPLSGILGQEQALAALDFGARIRSGGFHVAVIGPPGTGKRTAVKAALEKSDPRDPPMDWVYVNRFAAGKRMQALKLGKGRADQLAQVMADVVAELRDALPSAFAAEPYVRRRRLKEEEFRAEKETAFRTLQKRAEAQNIAMLSTPAGYAFAPVHEGRVVQLDVFNALPEALRSEVETKLRSLEDALKSILSDAPREEKARRDHLKELQQEVAREVISAVLHDARAAFSDSPAVLTFLDTVERDMVGHIELFLGSDSRASQNSQQLVGRAAQARLARYKVHVMTENGDDTKSQRVVEALGPTVPNLFGSIVCSDAEFGAEAMCLRIVPGALHRANGGTLLVDAARLLAAPGATDALKRAMQDGLVHLNANEAGSATHIDAEPILLDVKLILIADPDTWHHLSENDPEFRRLFKVEAVFESHVARSPETERAYARLIASIVVRKGLQHIDAQGVGLILEEAAKLAGGQDKLSLVAGDIADLVHEADHWAREAGRSVTTRSDIERALAERQKRSQGPIPNTAEVVAPL